MANESVTRRTTTKANAQAIVLWILGLFSSMYVLYYEYLWYRFVFHSLATISFSGWFWTSLTIALPWAFGFSSVIELRRAAKNGRASDDIFMNVSLLVQMAVLSAYWILAPAVQRLTSLGAMK